MKYDKVELITGKFAENYKAQLGTSVRDDSGAVEIFWGEGAWLPFVGGVKIDL